MTVDECIYEHGNANGKLEYSSTTVNTYALRDVVDSGPVKSKMSRFIGCVALMTTPGCGR